MTYKETLFFVGKCLTINHENQNKIIVEEELKSGKTDWDSVVKVGTAHFVFPALYCNLKRADFLHYLPEDLLAYMQHITDLNRERNQQIIDQAKEINTLLLANNIKPIFLKGTGNLLEGLYEDIAERMVGDIDFLVSDKDFVFTIKLLKQNQYKKTNDKLSSPLIVKHYPRIFNENKIAAVEVHKDMIRGKKSSYFNYNTVCTSIFKKKDVSILGYIDQLTLTILAHQHNDFGNIYKTLSLRNTYDAYLLSNKIGNRFNINKYFFSLLNNYLFVSSFFLKSRNINFKKTLNSKIYLKILLIKLEYPFLGKLHNHFFRILIYLNLKFKGGIRFTTNKQFREYYIKKLNS